MTAIVWIIIGLCLGLIGVIGFLVVVAGMNYEDDGEIGAAGAVRRFYEI